MKAMKGLSMNKVLGGIKRKPTISRFHHSRTRCRFLMQGTRRITEWLKLDNRRCCGARGDPRGNCRSLCGKADRGPDPNRVNVDP